jgi:GMP synthase (glutamine-hydrolysing)
VRILSLVHQADAGAGVFAEVAAARGADLVEWRPPDAPPPAPDAFGAALVLGGAMHVDQEEHHPWLLGEKALLRDLLAHRVPVLGVCLGAQLLAEAAGAAPRRAPDPEIGWTEVELAPEAEDDPLFRPLPDCFEAFQWHSYEFPLPPAARPLAISPACLQAYRIGNSAWGIQFHAEVTREDAEAWIDDYHSDEDAVRMRVDPDALRRRTRDAIDGWNALGRGLCERFLEAATRA